ncbi:hypothetical protein [Massilia sp. DWR3-1-1]|uniref:hypothetical protein n=1 Tax=Massilia sp. DWR3-1-1 TaxID=2804559 RepID=UPI003CF93751
MSVFFKKLSLSTGLFARQLPGSGGAVPLDHPCTESDLARGQRIAGLDATFDGAIDNATWPGLLLPACFEPLTAGVSTNHLESVSSAAALLSAPPAQAA